MQEKTRISKAKKINKCFSGHFFEKQMRQVGFYFLFPQNQMRQVGFYFLFSQKQMRPLFFIISLKTNEAPILCSF